MSEIINNSSQRKELLRHLLLRLHEGENPEVLRQRLIEVLRNIPYNEVVEVEQELINSNALTEAEILEFCDLHTAVLDGSIDLEGAKAIPAGHPVDTFKKENIALKNEVIKITDLFNKASELSDNQLPGYILQLRTVLNNLSDVDKHYLRKEYLLFPYLEKHLITGPPKVMWGKHDELRELIKGSIEVLQVDSLTREELEAAAEMVLKPAARGAQEMITKEEEILFPMALDTLNESDWYEISRQSIEIGFCLYDPPVDWRPEWVAEQSINESQKSGSHIQLPSGSFSAEELLAILNTLPVDMTFVDKDDKVKYFSQGAERIFQRNRAILNRDVRHCHPPASAHIVDKIIEDFKSGRENRAPFWINMGGKKMIHIEYFALRNEKGEYLGTLEVSQNVQPYRDLEDEQRILSYSKNKK